MSGANVLCTLLENGSFDQRNAILEFVKKENYKNMATKYGCVMLEKSLDLEGEGSDDQLREVQGVILDKIIFIPFDSSYDPNA